MSEPRTLRATTVDGSTDGATDGATDRTTDRTTGSTTGVTAEVAGRVQDVKADYTGGEERPLGSFVALMGAYGAGVAGLSALVAARGGGLPERVGAADLALISAATFEVSRLLAKDPVTSPLRAPFTRFAGTSGPAELADEVRGTGPRKALGELVTCPFCLGQWVATGFAFGLVLAPRATRLAATVFTTVAAADVLHFAYSGLQQLESKVGS